jgi:hypothetical protein
VDRAEQAKNSEPDSTRPRNWRHRKLANARRRHVTERRKQLVDGYVQALGGLARVTALVTVEIERCVDMTLLAEGMRARALRGEAIDIGELVRLEGAVSRVIRALNIPPPNAAPVQTLDEYIASQYPATDEAED